MSAEGNGRISHLVSHASENGNPTNSSLNGQLTNKITGRCRLTNWTERQRLVRGNIDISGVLLIN